MQVFGDRLMRMSSFELASSLRHGVRRVAAMPGGLARHSLLVELLIDAGMWAQGVADARCAATGEDGTGGDGAMALTFALARCCVRSWSTAFADCGELPSALLACCDALPRTDGLIVKAPEGYAFYALYPELHAEAALRCRTTARHWQVIGLRSIGTSLAAMVAAGLGAPMPRSVRPVGPPFSREIAAPLPEGGGERTAFAVVDEGPGLSGSSMAAAATWLLKAGVPLGRMHFFPGHAGLPGPMADARVRALWAGVARHHIGFEEGIRHAAVDAHRLRTWVEGLVGPLLAPLQDIGGGAWRGHQARHEGDTPPPAHPWQERPKYLATTRDGTWLVKFAGLGRAGQRALARARSLSAAGFTPLPAGLCHGFLVERWRDDLKPLPARLMGDQRRRLLARMADYLAFRARSFPAAEDAGASMEALLAMVRCNAKEALDDDESNGLERLAQSFRRAPARIARVETDNRMHRWEWLEGPTLLLKTDAVDHAAGHDLIGCQDIAWDVVGAEAEFELSADERQALASRIRRQGVPVDLSLIPLLRPCYLAFQWAHFAMAVDASQGDMRMPLVAERERYRSALRIALSDRSGSS